MKDKKFSLKNPALQSILTSLLCIVLGLLIGYIVLLMINPAGAGTAGYAGSAEICRFLRPVCACAQLYLPDRFL